MSGGELLDPLPLLDDIRSCLVGWVQPAPAWYDVAAYVGIRPSLVDEYRNGRRITRTVAARLAERAEIDLNDIYPESDHE